MILVDVPVQAHSWVAEQRALRNLCGATEFEPSTMLWRPVALGVIEVREWRHVDAMVLACLTQQRPGNLSIN